MIGKRNSQAVLTFVALLTLMSGSIVSAVDIQSDIERSLICACGCGKVLYDCYCDLGKEWKNQISNDLANGNTKQQIINVFIEAYGDQVLATPKKAGLELLIWIFPIFASIFGTVIIYRYAKKKAPIPASEIGAPILDSSQESSDKEDTEGVLLRYDEMFYEEYVKARKRML